MPSRRTVLSLVFSATITTACRNAPEAANSLRELGVTYTLPKGWTQEDAEDKRAVFMFAPEINGSVEASMMIELPRVRDVLTISDLLRIRAEELRAKYVDYLQHRLDPNVQAGEISFGILEYTATKKNIPLTEQHIQVRFGTDRTILMFTSVIASVAEDYRPILSAFMQSVRIASP